MSGVPTTLLHLSRREFESREKCKGLGIEYEIVVFGLSNAGVDHRKATGDICWVIPITEAIHAEPIVTYAGRGVPFTFLLYTLLGERVLSLLKKQGLVQDLGNTPSTYRGQWCLTDKGYERLYYLHRKTKIEKKEAEETEKQLRRLRKRVENLESHPWIIYEELAPISKQLCGVLRPMAIIETRKLPHDVLPYRRKFNRLLVEAEGIIKRLPEEEWSKVEALLFEPDELKLFFLRKLG